MRVVLVRNGEIIGRVDEDGPDEGAAPILAGVTVVEDGKLLTLDDGQAYLEGLVRVLDGPGVWADHEPVAASGKFDRPARR